MPPADRSLYDHDGVRLTARHLTVGGATYAVNSIAGVRVVERATRVQHRRQTNRRRAIVLVPLAGLALLVDVAVVGVGSKLATLAVWAGSVATLFAAWKAAEVRESRTWHAVALTIAGREVEVAAYDEPAEPGRVAAAVARAIGG